MELLEVLWAAFYKDVAPTELYDGLELQRVLGRFAFYKDVAPTKLYDATPFYMSPVWAKYL
jgi:hypothetical protein